MEGGMKLQAEKTMKNKEKVENELQQFINQSEKVKDKYISSTVKRARKIFGD